MKKLVLLFLLFATPANAGWFSNSPGSSGGGGGTGCVPVGGSAATNIVLYGLSGACSPDTNANLINGALVLGGSGTLGSVTMGNATSGLLKVQPTAGALGTHTLFFPAVDDTIATLAAAQTFSGNDIFSGTLKFSGLSAGTQASCLGLDSSNFVVTAACGGGGGSVSVTSASNDIVITPSPGTGTFTIGSTVPNVTKTANFTLTAAEMGGQVNGNGSSITITIPAISSTVFPTGATSLITSRNATALAISTTPTINGCGASASLGTYGFMGLTSNGTSLDGFCFPGFGTITSGALMKFSGTGGIATAGPVPGTGVETAIAANLSAAGGLSTTVASGTSALGTSAISSATCATVVTTSATNTATTDVVSWGFNGDPTAVTGYVPLVAGMLTIIAYPSANNVNFKVCNNTSSSVTPGAITLNWRVVR